MSDTTKHSGDRCPHYKHACGEHSDEIARLLSGAPE